MIIKKETKNGIDVYYVDKNISDEDMAQKYKNTYVKPSQIDIIVNRDADVYTKDGKLLLKFRKNKINKKNTSFFYDNVIQFAKSKTSNRGSASGSNKKNVADNPKIMTNIIGYFDKFSSSQKQILKKKTQKVLTVRETQFMMKYPEKFKQLVPMIEDIDHLYAKYVPEQYSRQKKKANQTHFKIANTAFTTITTNVNFQTTIHKDSGDDAEGFGNLSVIEKGKYFGSETCFPQYGVGVDVRTGDILLMDVHEWHGNIKMKPETKDAERLSIVCYLRKNVWLKTQHKTKKFMVQHNRTVRNLLNYSK
jgi:hypothetical protein